ncbi:hypothetical protein HLRTI_002426 [Halorhabdus tiamatea SARL4B]|uniref:KaiC-like domain-containing protein n=1 Tax=Halorhabdus tiamatea SARL4B TaxID=1033806 RepID=F7PHC0_9EURY|nr:hypothetical protein [Halorhabdus tiamatea]ERJ05544.1 hypothetical protein HLRTI_002426 [Halorhabdus tiamatea SARL4B]CCQ32539.1 conserved hypothetical protein [Halorhabdus tiamatea SARL4B]
MSFDIAEPADLPEDADNVLCISPEISPNKEACCEELLTREGVPDKIVGVTVASSPGGRMAEWGEAINPMTTDLTFVDVSHGGRSAAMSADGFGGQNGALVDVIEVPDVDLREIGSAVTDQLDGDTDETIVVCLDSLTDLLQFESEETLSRFLHVLTARVSEAGGSAHYHIDAHGHPDRVFETLSPLFDATVRTDADLE